MATPTLAPSKPEVAGLAQVTAQADFRPVSGGPAAQGYTNNTAASSLLATYQHVLDWPVQDLSIGLFVAGAINPCNLLGFQFIGGRGSSGDPNGRCAVAQLWLLKSARPVTNYEELLCHGSVKFNLTCGDLAVATGSKFAHETSTVTCKWVDTIASLNDKTLSPGARTTGGVGDDIQSVWVDAVGARGFVLHIQNVTHSGLTALDHCLPLFAEC